MGKHVKAFSCEFGLSGAGEGEAPAVREGESFRDVADLATDLATDKDLVVAS